MECAETRYASRPFFDLLDLSSPCFRAGTEPDCSTMVPVTPEVPRDESYIFFPRLL